MAQGVFPGDEPVFTVIVGYDPVAQGVLRFRMATDTVMRAAVQVSRWEIGQVGRRQAVPGFPNRLD